MFRAVATARREGGARARAGRRRVQGWRARLGEAGRRLVHQIMRDDVLGLAAELAYRSFLALIPFFMFLAAVGAEIGSSLQLQNPTEPIVGLLGEALPPGSTWLVR